MPAWIHWFVGTLGVLVFVLQGQYMLHVLGPLPDLADGPRMLYRSGHIYLLFASLLNLVLARATAPAPGWRRVLHRFAGAIAALAPFVFIAGFLLEAPSGTLDRPITGLGLYALFGAGVAWAVLALPFATATD